MKKIVFIVPGFWGLPHEKVYEDIAALYKSKGLEPVILNIPWKRQVMSDYVNYFINVYDKHKDEEIHLFGWSFGAMISFIAASKIKTNTIFLCSISPYLKEDMKLILKSWKRSVGKKRMADFAGLSRIKINKTIRTKRVIMLVGTKEGKTMIKVSKAIYRSLDADKKIVIIEGAGHNIAREKYFQQIKRQIELLI